MLHNGADQVEQPNNHTWNRCNMHSVSITGRLKDGGFMELSPCLYIISAPSYHQNFTAQNSFLFSYELNPFRFVLSVHIT